MGYAKAIAGAAIAVAAVYVAWAGWSGRSVPFGITGAATLWVAVGLGLTACAVGGIGEGLARAGNNWLNPWIVAGIVLGVVTLAAIVAAAVGVQAGPIASQSEWLLVVGVLIGTKVVVASAHGLAALATKG